MKDLFENLYDDTKEIERKEEMMDEINGILCSSEMWESYDTSTVDYEIEMSIDEYDFNYEDFMSLVYKSKLFEEIEEYFDNNETNW